MIDSHLRALAAAWLAADRTAIVVEVEGSRGSTPRGVGTRMLVAADGSAGTIGGGHLELKAITIARAMLATSAPQTSHGSNAPPTPPASHGARPRRETFALGPSLGQCCGGAIRLGFAPLDAEALARWPASTPLFRLQLHGAGHVGRAIATLLATLDVEVDWFDQRDDGFADATALGSVWPAHIRRTSVDTVEAEVRHAAPGAFYLVLTHEHALDLRITEAILRRGDFGFVGLIGSKTKRASFTRRLLDRGIEQAVIARLTCPIGVPGIDGREPEVIAMAVVAQLLQSSIVTGRDVSTTSGGRETPKPGSTRRGGG